LRNLSILSIVRRVSNSLEELNYLPFPVSGFLLMMIALSFTTGDAAAMIFVATFSPQCEVRVKEAGKVTKY